MKSKLLRAIEETVRWYETLAVDGWQMGKCCPLCDAYEGEQDCGLCPIYKLEADKGETGDCCDFAYQLMNIAMTGWDGDIPSCLAIMVYVWGFVNFGQDFE